MVEVKVVERSSIHAEQWPSSVEQRDDIAWENIIYFAIRTCVFGAFMSTIRVDITLVIMSVIVL